ncbi:MAG: inositol monophosphatase family protein [Paracoccus sp. (in: a-proteobacteria)]|nr:inositol monophosphatase family protein [Paracoccus sp. (in: a-proteobacteria)]
MERQDIFETAAAMADAARAQTLPLFRSSGLRPDNKLAGGFDPVTEADRASERVMRHVLAERRPEDAILGEEFGTQPGTSGLTWVLDPIDGTRAFISGAPSWGTLIGLNDQNGPVYGMIDQPFMGERFEGGFGRARMISHRGEVALATRKAVPLAEATLLSTFPEIGTADDHAAFRRVADRVRLTRYGLDCYGYALLALGMVDLVIEAGIYPYDVVAPIAVVTAAGGTVTNWEGGPAHGGGRIIAAATPEIHAEALALLSG